MTQSDWSDSKLNSIWYEADQIETWSTHRLEQVDLVQSDWVVRYLTESDFDEYSNELSWLVYYLIWPCLCTWFSHILVYTSHIIFMNIENKINNE